MNNRASLNNNYEDFFVNKEHHFFHTKNFVIFLQMRKSAVQTLGAQISQMFLIIVWKRPFPRGGIPLNYKIFFTNR